MENNIFASSCSIATSRMRSQDLFKGVLVCTDDGRMSEW